MKKSIRSKINRLIITSIAVLSALMLCIILFIINRYTEKDSETMMENTCSAKKLELDDQFRLVEQSVNNIYDISENFRPSVGELATYEKTENFIDTFKELAITIAENTEGAITVYYRINPDLNINGTQGFFYVKAPDSDVFEPHEIVDLLEYDVNDVEHVGWYYIPVWAGKAVWMEPYYNANIGVEMISYVMPVFDGSRLIAVIGMDVDFDRLIEISEDVKLYKQSGAVLASMSNGSIYYKRCDVFGNQIPAEMYRILQGADNSEKKLEYSVEGTAYNFYYKTLENHMKLIIYAKKSDINEQESAILLAGILIYIIITALTMLVTVRLTKKLIVPIESITEATRQYAKGNWDAKVDCDTDDELRILSDNIGIMADNTKQYINYIKDMAKRDALTGLRNKTDYLLYVDKIKGEYINQRREFAIAIFDLNNLKMVNDTYGHEKGDALIIAASKTICSRFSHSPVFRIGGDEFVAILDSDDYVKRGEILEEFEKHMRLARDSRDVFEVCIACGMAVFGEDGKDFDTLFETADHRMYQNKKELKEG